MAKPRLVHLMMLSVLCLVSMVQTADSNSPQVIGGDDVPEGKYPFMASLHSLKKGRHTCGATILTETTVLTAAHCVKGSPPSEFQLVIGSVDQLNKGSKYKVASIRTHPKYGTELVNDIAVLKLDDKIDFGERKTVTQVCLPKMFDEPDAVKCRVIGWGLNRTDTKPAPQVILQEAILPIIDRDKCRRPATILCAGQSLRGGNTSACFGDSGGPLLCPVKGGGKAILQYGITSSVSSSACNQGPVSFTRVAYFIDWIRKNAH